MTNYIDGLRKIIYKIKLSIILQWMVMESEHKSEYLIT